VIADAFVAQPHLEAYFKRSQIPEEQGSQELEPHLLRFFSCTKAESALRTDVDMTRHYLQSRVVPSYDCYDAPHAKRGASVASLEDWTLGEELSEERQRFLDEIERVICGIIYHTRSYTYGRNQVRLRIAPHSAVVKSVNFTYFGTDTRGHT
jgi:hypothetical protein